MGLKSCVLVAALAPMHTCLLCFHPSVVDPLVPSIPIMSGNPLCGGQTPTRWEISSGDWYGGGPGLGAKDRPSKREGLQSCGIGASCLGIRCDHHQNEYGSLLSVAPASRAQTGQIPPKWGMSCGDGYEGPSFKCGDESSETGRSPNAVNAVFSGPQNPDPRCYGGPVLGGRNSSSILWQVCLP